MVAMNTFHIQPYISHVKTSNDSKKFTTTLQTSIPVNAISLHKSLTHSVYSYYPGFLPQMFRSK